MIPGGLGDFSLRWYSNSKTPKIKGEVVITGAEVETDPDDETGFQAKPIAPSGVSGRKSRLDSRTFVPLRAPPVLLKRLPTLAKVNIVPTVRGTFICVYVLKY
eukprot:421304-Amorphochlora_amoeboformis.AAC.1